ncbi:MAG: sulfite exporter TauE/SafE family protein [Deltaproteobacteria bacterium]|nr:sulfite exporter TauE/SafE family protein [Deltaproteobacteria bacterium]
MIGLALVVTVAFLVETVTGFGGTVVAVALASFFMPVREYLPAHVPVNLLLSTWIVARDWAAVDRALLFRRVLPAMVVGFPLGAWAFSGLSAHHGVLEAAFGGFVALVGACRLAGPVAMLGPVATQGTLAAAGVVHGAFGTGGPLVVITLSRIGLDKATFRATLSALWIVLSFLLLALYAREGVLGEDSARASLVLLPGLLAGGLAGQWVHGRIDAERFRRAVDGMLLLAGLLLLWRNL